MRSVFEKRSEAPDGDLLFADAEDITRRLGAAGGGGGGLRGLRGRRGQAAERRTEGLGLQGEGVAA